MRSARKCTFTKRSDTIRKEIEVSEEQFQNALSSIEVTLFGMVIEVNEEQSENAPFPIEVTLSSIIIFLICFVRKYQGYFEQRWPVY